MTRKQASPLQPYELELAASFLEDASADFEDRSADETFLPARKESLAIAAQMKAADGDDAPDVETCRIPGDDADVVQFYTSQAMEFFSRRCRELAISAGSQPLNGAELGFMAELLELAGDAHEEVADEVCFDLTLDVTSENKTMVTAAVDHYLRRHRSSSADGKRATRAAAIQAAAVRSAAGATVDIPDYWLMFYLAERFRAWAPRVLASGETAVAANPGSPTTDPKWKSGWKAHHKNRLRWFEQFFPLQCQELEHYAATGMLSRQVTGIDLSQYEQWERLLSLDLGLYGLLQAFELEATGIRENAFDHQVALSAYSATRLAQMIDLNIHIKAPARLGVSLSSMDPRLTSFAALGIVIGDPSALALARLLVAACRRGWYVHDGRHTVHEFMMLLVARFLDEEAPPPSAWLAKSPLAALLTKWSAAQPDEIAPLCRTACDYHIARSNHREDMDFSAGDWCYTPIEIMLLMRLRSLRGLANPTFEHPLWSDVFADVVPAGAMQPDELVERVEQRMRANRYDETVIAQAVLAA